MKDKKDEDIANKIIADELKDIIHQASRENAILLSSYRELRRLPRYLQEDEQIVAIVTGTPTNYKVLRLRRGIVVATDRRLIFIHDGWIFRTIQDFPYTSVNSVEFTTRLFFGDLVVFGFGDQIQYKWVGRIVGTKFAKTVRQLIVDVTDGDPTTHPRNRVPIEYGQSGEGLGSQVAPQYPTANTPEVEQPTTNPTVAPDNFISPGRLPFNPTRAGETMPPPPIVPHPPVVGKPTPHHDRRDEQHYDRVTTQLEKLTELRDKGLITEEEYSIKRQSYIDRL